MCTGFPIGRLATMLATGPLLIWRFGPVGASTSMVLACLAVWLVAHGFARRYVGHAPSLWIAVPPVGLALGLLLASEQLDFPWTWRLGGAALGFAVAALCLDRKLIGSLKFLNGSQQVDRDEA